MALHFDPADLAARRQAACAAVAARGLDALLVFRQESLYYLTGFDTFGYVYFQVLVLRADGRMTLLTRAPDLRQAHRTSVIEDVRVWTDADGATPEAALRDILAEHGLADGRLGVEWHAYGLTAAVGQRLAAALEGVAVLEDASDLVSRLRLVKSPAEIAYTRRAAHLADDALDAALTEIRPGAFEGDILAAMHGAIYRGGGDDPANEFVIGSGPDALLCRYHSGRRHLDAQDQLTLEWAGVYRHYHAAMMRTIPVGRALPGHREMLDVTAEAMAACLDAMRPGNTCGDVFAAHARVIDAAGRRAGRLNACGYAMGTTFAPNWMDWPMLYAGNPVVLESGMVFFLHMILYDDDAGLAMCPGQSALVTDAGGESLSRHPVTLTVAV
ncbi:M24 family metallopeptidase [Roseospira navarrensis]|uniref:M24 family metallopeptidase n=1 Tax=Roseospira navarrensis TaxID=140058 RepID=A0A7X1ZFM9_9PROT|nr:Xaa-Pro peptidase family protein [Roseospira navarrensis]MQX37685.1 M24 family metallopeptidase [Roseospira navarrensis]